MHRYPQSKPKHSSKTWIIISILVVLCITLYQCSSTKNAPSSYSQYTLPSSITFAGKAVPLDDPKTYERVDTAFQILAHDQRGQIHLWLKRLAKYRGLIEEQLEKEGVHKDFMYLAVKESSLHPCPTSSAQARGMWQFIEGTGKKYGLIIDDIIDERCDLFKATTAAAQYLKDLMSEQYFKGDPFLAMAGYNDGEIDVLNMIRIQQHDKKKLGYFSSFTNNETGNYVPGIIALKVILENPTNYGFHIEPDYKAYNVAPMGQVFAEDSSIRSVVEALEIDYLDFKIYNPHFRIFYTEKNILPKDRRYNIYLPEEYRERLQTL